MSRRAIARGMRPHPQPLDEDSAGRLLQGAVHPDDAPPGYGSVAQLLHSAARLSLAPVDEEKAAATVAAMVEALRNAAPAPQTSRRRPMLGKLLAGKALAAVAVLGLTATGAAAATGSLPDRVQGAVADAIDNVGVHIPHPNHGKSAEHRQDGDHRQDGNHGQPEDVGQPSETGQPEKDGQKTSDAAHAAKDAAKAAGDPVGPAVCTAVTDGKCQAGMHGADGGPDKGTTPPSSGPAENRGQGKGPVDGGEDEEDDADSPETPGAGGLDTGAAKSGKVVPVGKGKPAGDN